MSIEQYVLCEVDQNLYMLELYSVFLQIAIKITRVLVLDFVQLHKVLCSLTSWVVIYIFNGIVQQQDDASFMHHSLQKSSITYDDALSGQTVYIYAFNIHCWMSSCYQYANASIDHLYRAFHYSSLWDTYRQIYLYWIWLLEIYVLFNTGRWDVHH